MTYIFNLYHILSKSHNNNNNDDDDDNDNNNDNNNNNNNNNPRGLEMSRLESSRM